MVKTNGYKKYYYYQLERLYAFLVPKGSSTLRLKTEKVPSYGKYDYIIADYSIGDVKDIQGYFQKIKKLCHDRTRIVVTYYNHFWEPVLKLASSLGWRKVTSEQNWVDNQDLENLLSLTGFETITMQKRMLIPVEIPLLTKILNEWISHLPFINTFCLITYVIAKPIQNKTKDYSVSIIVPARNEEGNIPKIVDSIPKFGKSQEIIFVEGHSKDDTWNEITKALKKSRKKKVTVKAYEQTGVGKGNAVRLGFSKATGQILMILDADLSVNPDDLVKFYNSLSQGLGDFANGSRLVYPMEKDAMRTLNKIGNSLFSWLFTWILGQRFRDTLCGTKALFRKDYEVIKKGKQFFGEKDPFGDFDLIFGVIKLNLKVIEIPIRYRERTYGSTNIDRFRHGFMLLRMIWAAFNKFRAI